MPTWRGFDETDEQVIPDSPYKREIVASKIYSFNDAETPKVIASVLHKMTCSPRLPVKLTGRTNYIRLLEDSWVWSTLPQGFTLNFDKFPTSRAKSMILLADLRGGAHGRVWLACSATGAGCVIKFARDDTETLQNMLLREKDVWNNVWKRPARIQCLGGARALVMPYVQPCPEADRSDPKVVEAVKAAVVQLARHGIQHNDLKWEHVGLFRKVNEEVGAVLFDLSNSETTQGEEALLKMLADLQLS